MNINIPSPCQQDWNAMQPRSDGRFCEHCQETVADFSNMSDEAMIQFLKTNPFTPCARFSHTQLNRTLSVQQIIKQRSRFYKAKIAACLMMLLSPKTIFAQPKPGTNPSTRDSSKTTSAVLSGFITNAKQEAFRGVKVFFDEQLVDTTNEKGLFSFQPNLDQPQHRIKFEAKPGRFHTENYHNEMGSVEYNISLDSAFRQYHSKGLPRRPFLNDIYSDCRFKPGSTKMSSDSLADINFLATAMRTNPNARIKITLCFTNDKTKKLSIRRYECLLKKMIDEQGIDKERFIFDLKKVNIMDDHVAFSSDYTY